MIKENKTSYVKTVYFPMVVFVSFAMLIQMAGPVFAHHAEEKAKRPASQFLAIGNSIGFNPKDPDRAEAYRQKAGKVMKEEAQSVWKLYTDEIIRQVYIVDAISHNHEYLAGKEVQSPNALKEVHLHKDAFAVIMILECADIHEAREKLSALPFVKTGLVDFQIYSLMPYIMLPSAFSEEPKK